MFEMKNIKEYMKVVDHDGHSIGIVNGVIDDLILLARSGAGDLHHCVPLRRVEDISENCVRLK